MGHPLSECTEGPGDFYVYRLFVRRRVALSLLGENVTFAAASDHSLISFIAALGGGSLTLVSSQNAQTVQPPFTGPNPIAAISLRAVAGTNTAGTGAPVYERRGRRTCVVPICNGDAMWPARRYGAVGVAPPLGVMRGMGGPGHLFGRSCLLHHPITEAGGRALLYSQIRAFDPSFRPVMLACHSGLPPHTGMVLDARAAPALHW